MWYGQFELKILFNKSKSWQIDIFVLTMLILVSPLTYKLNSTTGMFTPDSFAYITLSKLLLSSGQLFIESLGHIDAGLILPPIFPLVINVFGYMSDNPLKNAELISAGCMLFSVVPMFLYVRQMTNYIIAVFAAVVFQLNYYYIYFGPAAYTESCFLLLLFTCLWLTYKLELKQVNYLALAIIVGVLGGMLFLTRQIGITFILFLGIWHGIQIFLHRKDRHGLTLSIKKISLILFGWAVIFIPYSSILYIQTGESPFQQSFRMNKHVVQLQETRIIAELNEINNLPEDDYNVTYHKRRLLRKLTPDSSEMLGYVQIAQLDLKNNTAHKSPNLLGRSFNALANPVKIFVQFITNALYLVEPLGYIGFSLFIMSMVTPVFVKSKSMSKNIRLLIPVYVFIYLLSISILGDLIDRYVIILFPLCIVQVSIEFFVITSELHISSVKKQIAAVFLAICLLPPKYFFEEHLYNFDILNYSEWGKIRSLVNKDDAIFTLAPVYAYLAGGKYRAMPNDELEKVIRYAGKTGVDWILVSSSENDQREIQSYIFANWLNQPGDLENHSTLLTLCCSINSTHFLYKIKESD